MRVISGIHSGAMFMNLVTAIIIYLNCELCTNVVASDNINENVTTHGPVVGLERSIEISSETPLPTTILVNTTIGKYSISTTTESTWKLSTEERTDYGEKETTYVAISSSQPSLTESSNVTLSLSNIPQLGMNVTTTSTSPIDENIDTPVIIPSEKVSGCSTTKRKQKPIIMMMMMIFFSSTHFLKKRELSHNKYCAAYKKKTFNKYS
jgi:hypothetical protein